MASSINVKSAQTGYITLCANCSLLKITETHWIAISKKFKSQFALNRQISHGICPQCMKRLYGDLFSDNLDEKTPLAYSLSLNDFLHNT
ncbi:MAG: hypothetical protein ACTSWW_12475 [Promethearchaeota archaeon]